MYPGLAEQRCHVLGNLYSCATDQLIHRYLSKDSRIARTCESDMNRHVTGEPWVAAVAAAAANGVEYRGEVLDVHLRSAGFSMYRSEHRERQ